MKVIRAEVLGFCMGVRRAVEFACREIACRQAACRQAACKQAACKQAVQSAANKVYTLGPLIHNPQVLDELKAQGVEMLDERRLPQNLNGASVIIRAHGVNPQLEAELRERGAKVIDATCPRVKASQLKAAALVEAGYRLFLAGEAGHAEMLSIKGYASGCIITGDAAEAEKAAAALYAQDSNVKTALIGQTTISAVEYQAIGEAITRYFPALEIVQTICAATRERQDSLRKLLDKADAVVIAGGKDSANTRRLLAIAEAAGKPCALVETQADIPASFAAFETVGLAAGASTPDSLIGAIERALIENG
ncbi:MAG: 4-hydroxy-3-methylbut-2-enyl diphosphate reductase [Treponema sp.]|nr:4-hydroxy-3-methylbut-2-enyl diphosphate reductase [Treponema sp.]